MWRNPLLIAGQGESAQVFITERTEQADLYVLLGQPSTPINWEITVDGVEMLGFRIENTFPAGSTFTFTLINGAQIIGFGGFGGNGGDVSTTSEGPGVRGGAGGAAIDSVFDISVNADDGYLFGGGGGGGGGAGYKVPSSTSRIAGSGGGGGAGFKNTIDSPSFPSGFFTSSPGIAGTGYTGAAPSNGGFGNGATPGVGGANANAGGEGGLYGSAGLAGTGLNPFTQQFFNATGGAGGNAGRAFYGRSGSSMTLTGSKSEATLRAEGRIKGQSKAPYFTGGSDTAIGNSGSDNRYSNEASVGATSTHGFVFNSDGSLQFLDGGSDPLRTNLWLKGTGAVGADFEMRQVSGPGTTQTGTWDTEASAINTWISLASNRTYSFSHGGGTIRSCGRLFEFRRADVPGNPDDEILGRLWLIAVDEGAV